MRLDKYLGILNIYSRKQSRKIIKRGGFFINGTEIFDSAFDVKEGDILTIEGQSEDHHICRNITLRLRKPAGYVSSDTAEGPYPSYKELLQDCPYAPLVHVAGRLDADTEGLVILTSDGQLNHKIISPKHECKKLYRVTCEHPLTKKEAKRLEKGVILDDGYTTLPATCSLIEPNEKGETHTIHLTLTEGKYHQVKRMLEAINNKVTHLKRETVGEWTLEGLESGEWEYV